MDMKFYKIYVMTFILIGCANDPVQYTYQDQAFAFEQEGKSQTKEITEVEPPKPVIEKERFDVVSKNHSADTFFNALVKGMDINILVHPEIKKNITINLKNVTLEETLLAIRDVYGLEFLKTEYGYQILPRKIRNKVFHVNYLNVTREGRSGLSVSSGHIYNSGDSNTNLTSNDMTTATRLDTQATSDFWSNLRESLQILIGNGEDRKRRRL